MLTVEKLVNCGKSLVLVRFWYVYNFF